MDHQDIRTLQILEEIEQNQTPSQRAMAKKLNVSLGLVNSFIKRLAHKGYFKITHIPSNRVRYILTPKGAAEKTRLTYLYIKYSINFYKAARQKLRVLFRLLAEQGVCRVVFYGVSDLAEIAFLSLQEFPIELAGIIDDEKQGDTFFGFAVSAFDQLREISYDKIIITRIITEVAPGKEMIENIKSRGVPAAKIVEIQ